MKRLNRRNGYTLIEMLTIMSVAAVLMLVNVGWIHQSMKFASIMNQRQRHHQNLLRLAAELRDDVRDSDSILMNGEGQLLLQRDDGSQVTYTISGTSISVERSRAENLSGKEMTIRDGFALAKNSDIRWGTSELPDWISLVVSRGREGVPTRSSEDLESDSRSGEIVPVDLHVRVGPNRWPGSPNHRAADATKRSADSEPNQEELK